MRTVLMNYLAEHGIDILDGDLEHSGIKGQRWGVRRFQNEDRTWTEDGKERYGSGKTFHKLNPEDVQVTDKMKKEIEYGKYIRGAGSYLSVFGKATSALGLASGVVPLSVFGTAMDSVGTAVTNQGIKKQVRAIYGTGNNKNKIDAAFTDASTIGQTILSTAAIIGAASCPMGAIASVAASNTIGTLGGLTATHKSQNMTSADVFGALASGIGSVLGIAGLQVQCDATNESALITFLQDKYGSINPYKSHFGEDYALQVKDKFITPSMANPNLVKAVTFQPSADQTRVLTESTFKGIIGETMSSIGLTVSSGLNVTTWTSAVSQTDDFIKAATGIDPSLEYTMKVKIKDVAKSIKEKAGKTLAEQSSKITSLKNAGYSVAEIAKKLNIPEGSVSSVLYA